MEIADSGLTAPEIEAKVFVAPQWKLVWWKFRKHKIALFCGVIMIIIYLIALFADFLAPFDPTLNNSDYLYAPPQAVHLFNKQGQFGLYVYGLTSTVDTEALRRVFSLDTNTEIPLRWFAKGWPYKFLGLFPTDRHLFGSIDPAQPVYLLGA